MSDMVAASESLATLKTKVDEKRAEYIGALEKSYRRGASLIKMTDAEVSLGNIADAMGAFMPIQRAKLAYEEAKERYEGALSDRRAFLSALNSWLMLAVTIAITAATIVQAYKAH